MKYIVYGLYKKQIDTISSIDDSLYYIGITDEKNLYFRMKNHFKDCNIHKINILNKYGLNYKILWYTNTKEESEKREEFLISWFKRDIDGGILTNIALSVRDYSYLNKPISNVSRKRMQKARKKWLSKSESLKKARDCQLSVPYEQVMKLIELWANNPFESKTFFCKKHNINRGKFKDWCILYKPEYLSLSVKLKYEVFNHITLIRNEYNTLNDAIVYSAKIHNIDFKQCRSIYFSYHKKYH